MGVGGGHKNPQIKRIDFRRFGVNQSSVRPGDLGYILNSEDKDPIRSPATAVPPSQGGGSINPSTAQQNTLPLSPDHLHRIRTRQNMANQLQQKLNQKVQALANNHKVSISIIDATNKTLSNLNLNMFKIRNPDLPSHSNLSSLERFLIIYYKEFPQHFDKHTPSSTKVSDLIEHLNKNNKP